MHRFFSNHLWSTLTFGQAIRVVATILLGFQSITVSFAQAPETDQSMSIIAEQTPLIEEDSRTVALLSGGQAENGNINQKEQPTQTGALQDGESPAIDSEEMTGESDIEGNRSSGKIISLSSVDVLLPEQHVAEKELNTQLGSFLAQISKDNSEDVKTVELQENVVVQMDTVEVEIDHGTMISAKDGVVDAPQELSLQGISTSTLSNSQSTEFEFGIPTEHLIFTKPVQITVHVDQPDGTTVDLGVKHLGDTDFGTQGLSTDPDAECNSGEITYPSSIGVVQNGQVVFYTCGASTFIVNAASNSIKLRLSADTGVVYNGSNQVSQWNNKTSLSLISQASRSASNAVIYSSGGFNFNPGIRFKGTSNGSLLGQATSNLGQIGSIIAVVKPMGVNSDPNNFGGFFSVTAPTAFNDGTAGIGLYFAQGTNFLYGTDGAGGHGATTVSNGILQKVSIVQGDYRTPGTTANTQMYLNGVLEQDDQSSSYPTTNRSYFEIGGRSANGSYVNRIFNGYVAEVIYYSNTLTATERQYIDSYLAIKYGITLGHDYIDSSGSVVYNVSSFANDIAGIARDDGYNLYQKQSSSFNDSSWLTVGLGGIQPTNALNTSTLSDKFYMVWGDNGSSTGFTVSLSGGLIGTGMARMWKISEQGTVGTVRVAIPATSAFPTTSRKLVLSNDAQFDSSDTFVDLQTTTINGQSMYYADVDPSSSQYLGFVSLKVVACGDGATDLGETCDDGNTTNGDGCSSMCQVETGYFCNNPTNIIDRNITRNSATHCTVPSPTSFPAGMQELGLSNNKYMVTWVSNCRHGFFGGEPAGGNILYAVNVRTGNSPTYSISSFYNGTNYDYYSTCTSAATVNDTRSYFKVFSGENVYIGMADHTLAACTDNVGTATYRIRSVSDCYLIPAPAITSPSSGASLSPGNITVAGTGVAGFTISVTISGVTLTGAISSTGYWSISGWNLTTNGGYIAIAIQSTGSAISSGTSVSFYILGTCGNGLVGSGEACDDGNTANGDGCSSTCQIEAGFTCSNLIQNGTFDTGSSTRVNGGGRTWNANSAGGYIYNDTDGANNLGLSQSISGLQVVNNRANFSIDIGGGDGANALGNTARLEVWFGGQKFADFNNPTGSTPISVTTYGGATTSPNSFPIGMAGYTRLNINIPVTGGQLILPPKLLEFRMYATTDDWMLDNIQAGSNCKLTGPSITSPVSGSVYTNTSNITIAGTGTPGYTINVTISGQTLTGSIDSSGNWSISGRSIHGSGQYTATANQSNGTTTSSNIATTFWYNKTTPNANSLIVNSSATGITLGQCVTLTGIATGDVIGNIDWSVSGSVVQSGSSYVYCPTVPGTSTVTATIKACTGGNLVANGDFDAGNVGFTSTYPSCSTANCLWSLMGYGVNNSASFLHNGFQGLDHTNGLGKFMVINGADPAKIVWKQTLNNLTPGSLYAFKTYASTMNGSISDLQFSINNTLLGNIFQTPSNPLTWSPFNTIWTGSTTSADIEIVAINASFAGYDFGLDDIAFCEVNTITQSITVDVLQLDKPGITSPVSDSYVTTTTPLIAGTGTPGYIVNVQSGLTTLCTGIVSNTGFWSCVSSSLPQGLITVTANQQTGSSISSGVSTSFIIDSVAPIAPTILSPISGSILSHSPSVINGTGEAGTLVTVVVGGQTLTGTVSSTGYWSVSPTTLVDGNYTATAHLTDAAGNTGSSTATSFVVDTTAPSAPTILSPVSGSYLASGTVTVQGTGEPGATLHVVDTTNGFSGTVTVSASGTWSVTFVGGLDGYHTFIAQQTDIAGNVSPTSATSVVIDTITPVITFTDDVRQGPISGDTISLSITDINQYTTGQYVYTPSTICDASTSFTSGVNFTEHTSISLSESNNGMYICAQTIDKAGNIGYVRSAYPLNLSSAQPSVALSFTGADPRNTGFVVTITLSEPVSGFTLSDVSVTNGTPSSLTQLSPTSYTVSITPTADGEVSVMVDTGSFINSAENPNTVSNTIHVMYDATAPAVPVCTAIPNPGSGTALITITCTNIASGDVLTIPGTSCTPTPSTGTDVICTGIGSVIGSDPIARVVDPATNVSTGTVPFTLDTTAPTAPTILTPVNGSRTNDNTPTISGTGESGAMVSVIEGTTILCSDIVKQDGTWNCVSTQLIDGDHSITAYQTDIAGNQSPTAHQSFVVDTTSPDAPTILTPISGTMFSGSTITITGTGEANATIKVIVHGQTLTGHIDSSGQWSVTFITVPDGTWQAVATQNDGLNPDSPSISTTFMIDTGIPSAPVFVGPRADQPLTAHTYQIVGTGEPGAMLTLQSGNDVICWVRVSGSGTRSCQVTNVPDGRFTYNASQADTFGNTSPKSYWTVTVYTPTTQGVTFTPSVMEETQLATPKVEQLTEKEPVVNPKTETSPVDVKYSDQVIVQTSNQPISFDALSIYNPDIATGTCFVPRPLQPISSGFTTSVSIEFLKAMVALKSYELTRFNDVDQFEPYDNLTREEAAKFLSQFAMNVLCRKPDPAITVNYQDIGTADPTLKQYIVLAKQLKIMKGRTEAEFKPKDNISRAEFTAALVRLILYGYLDESLSQWWLNYEQVSTELGLISQDIDDQTPINRNDASLILFRAMKKQRFDLFDVGYETYIQRLYKKYHEMFGRP